MADRRAHRERIVDPAIRWLQSQGWRVWTSVPGGAAPLVAVRCGTWALVEVRARGWGDPGAWNRLWEAAQLGQALPLWKTDTGWWRIAGPLIEGTPRPATPWPDHERSR